MTERFAPRLRAEDATPSEKAETMMTAA